MKKSLMILASVALGASMSVGQDVESKNVVGFADIGTLPVEKYTAVGWQFGLVGTPSNMPIAAITNYPGEKKGSNNGVSDWIRRYDNVNLVWTDYYNRTNSGWRKVVGGVTEATVTTDKISVGEMVMFFKRTADSVGFKESGEVFGDSVTILLPVDKYTAMCNPFPVEVPIVSITNYPGEKKGSNNGVSDWIRRYDNVNLVWTDYYNRTNSGWRKVVGGVTEATVTGDSLGIGEGIMFFKRTNNGQITFNSPVNN